MRPGLFETIGLQEWRDSTERKHRAWHLGDQRLARVYVMHDSNVPGFEMTLRAEGEREVLARVHLSEVDILFADDIHKIMSDAMRSLALQAGIPPEDVLKLLMAGEGIKNLQDYRFRGKARMDQRKRSNQQAENILKRKEAEAKESANISEAFERSLYPHQRSVWEKCLFNLGTMLTNAAQASQVPKAKAKEE